MKQAALSSRRIQMVCLWVSDTPTWTNPGVTTSWWMWRASSAPTTFSHVLPAILERHDRRYSWQNAFYSCSIIFILRIRSEDSEEGWEGVFFFGRKNGMFAVSTPTAEVEFFRTYVSFSSTTRLFLKYLLPFSCTSSINGRIILNLLLHLRSYLTSISLPHVCSLLKVSTSIFYSIVWRLRVSSVSFSFNSH